MGIRQPLEHNKDTMRNALLITLSALLLLAFKSSPVTVFMIGDSTMAIKDTDKTPETGWGMPFATMFDKNVIVDNRAKNGRSTRTFLSENRWQPVLDMMKPGDYVFIQFGHNDESKEKVDRYTPPQDYTANLVKFVTETRAHKGIPILLTPVVRRHFDSAGIFHDSHGVYPDLVRAVAAQYHVPLIDMDTKSGKLLVQLGKDSSVKLFNQIEPGVNPHYPNGVHDNTHFNPYGAEQMALLAAQGVRELKLDIAKHLIKK